MSNENAEVFSLQDVSRITNIRETTLRFYLKRFRKYFEPIHRGPFNSIIFTDKDIKIFLKIRTFSKQHNLPMGEIEANLENENLPAISIVKEENSPLMVEEGVDNLVKIQMELKKSVSDNSLVLSELMATQQIMQEKQQRMLKFMQAVEAVPEKFDAIQQSLAGQTEKIQEIIKWSDSLMQKVERLEQENVELKKIVSGSDQGFWDRVWVNFKSWFFEDSGL